MEKMKTSATKVDNPYLVTFLNRTPIFKWYMVFDAVLDSR